MKKLILITVLSTALISCKKDNSQNVCYVCTDATGQELGKTCGKDKEDVRKNIVGPLNGVNYTYGTYPESEFNSRCYLKP